jgi:hypothetical protein
LRNCFRIFGFLGGIFWIFEENFLGGFFWEDFLGGILLEEFFGGNFFGRNSLFTLLNSVKLFEYDFAFCQDFVSMEGRRKEEF